MGRLLRFSGVQRTILGGVIYPELLTNKELARLVWGLWESAEIRLALRNIDGGTVIELGACIGGMVGHLGVRKSVDRYICVEANARNRARLAELVDRKISDLNCDILGCAVSYKANRGFSPTSVTGGRMVAIGDACDDLDLVPVATLSEIKDRCGIEENYTLITDIEGAEAEIFFYDDAALRTCKMIVAELEDTLEHSVEDQLRRLQEIGFLICERYSNVVCLKNSLVS